MTLWCSILSSNSYSMDITARCWSLLWPVVLLSHVWSRRKALKDRSHVQLLTGIVKATCITAFSEGNISESRSLYTASMSWTVPASLLRFLLLHLSLFPLTLTIIHKYIAGELRSVCHVKFFLWRPFTDSKNMIKGTQRRVILNIFIIIIIIIIGLRNKIMF